MMTLEPEVRPITENYVDPFTGANTNMVESHWRHVKRNILHYNRRSSYFNVYKLGERPIVLVYKLTVLPRHITAKRSIIACLGFPWKEGHSDILPLLAIRIGIHYIRRCRFII